MQSVLDEQPGSALQVWFWQIFPAPQSRESTHATHLPAPVSQTGAAGSPKQSVSRWQFPDGPGAQQPLAQWLPAAQPESLLQEGEPTQKPLSTQCPPAQVCGRGQSLSATQASVPLPPWVLQAKAAASARKARDLTCASSATPAGPIKSVDR
jgi:hypothetical protein